MYKIRVHQLLMEIVREINMTEIDIYSLVIKILKDMYRENIYDKNTLERFESRFEREFNYYLVELGDYLIDEFNNRKEEEKDECKR